MNVVSLLKNIFVKTKGDPYENKENTYERDSKNVPNRVDGAVETVEICDGYRTTSSNSKRILSFSEDYVSPIHGRATNKTKYRKFRKRITEDSTASNLKNFSAYNCQGTFTHSSIRGYFKKCKRCTSKGLIELENNETKCSFSQTNGNSDFSIINCYSSESQETIKQALDNGLDIELFPKDKDFLELRRILYRELDKKYKLSKFNFNWSEYSVSQKELLYNLALLNIDINPLLEGNYSKQQFNLLAESCLKNPEEFKFSAFNNSMSWEDMLVKIENKEYLINEKEENNISELPEETKKENYYLVNINREEYKEFNIFCEKNNIICSTESTSKNYITLSFKKEYENLIAEFFKQYAEKQIFLKTNIADKKKFLDIFKS